MKLSNMASWNVLLLLCPIVFFILVSAADYAATPATPPPTTPPPATPPPATPPPATPLPATPPPATPPPATPPPATPPPATPPPTTPTTTTPTTTIPIGQDLIPPEILSKLKLSLTISYSAMDQKSQLFFNTTLEKTLAIFYPYVEFYYIPCQRAQILNGDLFCCSGADPLCYLDKIHACAVAQIPSKLELSQFIICTMTGTAALPDYNKCAAAHGVDVIKLKACADTDIGKQLCINHIKNKIPGCNTTPGFIFQNMKDIEQPDQFDNFVNNACIADFSATVCGHLRSSNQFLPPKECDPRVTLGIFYKVIDENSQKWFDAMGKIYDKFSQFFIFKYNPCMFAEYHNGQLDCKSEEDKECVSGKMHSCAVAIIQDPAILFKFLACTMKDPKKLDAYEKCATDSQADYNALKTCVDTDVGKFLCYENSKKRPQTETFPAFSFDMNFNEAISQATAGNLQFTLCQQLRSFNSTSNYPEDCKESNKLLKLSIFYESMDYDFQCFMSTTFAENYDKFASFIELDFVPCRGAKDENGDLKCQSAIDPKCDVDKFESCVVKNIKDQTILVKILLCMMQNEGQLLPSYSDCLASVQADLNTVQTCATSDEGKQLCLENLKKSPKNDRHTAYQINDKYDEGVDTQLSENFLKGLCDQMDKNKVTFPNICYELKGQQQDQENN